jgi:hypothetical protein
MHNYNKARKYGAKQVKTKEEKGQGKKNKRRRGKN